MDDLLVLVTKNHVSSKDHVLYLRIIPNTTIVGMMSEDSRCGS